MKDFFEARRPHEGLTYDAYIALWEDQKAQSITKDMDKTERKYVHYLNYNYDRQEHVHEVYEPSSALRASVADLARPQLWMVLTEPWCGDSAYALPVIAEAAALTDRVDLRILLRDNNLDIMDQYLTGTSRSIPKLVAFEEDGTERFTWGPRPEEARSLRERLLEQDTDSDTVIQRLLAWYDDEGWMQVDEELAQCIDAAC